MECSVKRDTCYTNICEICRYKIDNCPFCYKRIDGLLKKSFVSIVTCIGSLRKSHIYTIKSKKSNYTTGKNKKK